MNDKLCRSSRWGFLFFLLPAVLYISCSNSPRNTTPDDGNSDYKKAFDRKAPSSFSDTITINFPTAVFFNPDSVQLEKIRNSSDTMIFESTMHDCFYQIRNSRIVLKKYYPRIKIMEAKNARYLLFEMVSGGKKYIDLNTNNEPCGMYVFDGQKAPSLVDMTNIESFLWFYFSK